MEANNCTRNLCITWFALIPFRFYDIGAKKESWFYVSDGNKSRKFSHTEMRWEEVKLFSADETGDDTFMLRRGLDADVHALIDEQIKLKTSFSSYFFFVSFEAAPRLKCKFRKKPIGRRRSKARKKNRKTKSFEWIIYDAEWRLKNWLELATTFAFITD